MATKRKKKGASTVPKVTQWAASGNGGRNCGFWARGVEVLIRPHDKDGNRAALKLARELAKLCAEQES